MRALPVSAISARLQRSAVDRLSLSRSRTAGSGYFLRLFFCVFTTQPAIEMTFSCWPFGAQPAGVIAACMCCVECMPLPLYGAMRAWPRFMRCRVQGADLARCCCVAGVRPRGGSALTDRSKDAFFPVPFSKPLRKISKF